MAHYDVIIATPGRDMNSSYVRSLTNTILELNNRGITWMWANDYCSHVSIARERTFNISAGNTYNKFFWIDSDISWQVEDFLKLYYSEKDIITGVYITDGYYTAAHNHYNMPISNEKISTSTDPIRILHCGFGFLCIKYGVNESMKSPLFRDIGINNEYIFPEDVSWCLRAGRHKYKIWMHPLVRVKHHKTVSLEWFHNAK